MSQQAFAKSFRDRYRLRKAVDYKQVAKVAGSRSEQAFARTDNAKTPEHHKEAAQKHRVAEEAHNDALNASGVKSKEDTFHRAKMAEHTKAAKMHDSAATGTKRLTKSEQYWLLSKAEAATSGMYDKAKAKAANATKKLVDLHHQRAAGGDVTHMHIAVAADAAHRAHEHAMVHATKEEHVNMHERMADKAKTVAHAAHAASVHEAFKPESETAKSLRSFVMQDFNDFFKSENTCGECGQTLHKSHGAPKGTVAADNKKSPKHAGSTGSNPIPLTRAKGGDSHKKNRTEKSDAGEQEETQQLRKAFPVNDTFKAVQYVGEDGSLYSEIEAFSGLR